MNENKKLKALRAAALEAFEGCYGRKPRGHRLTTCNEVAEWLLANQRDLVVAALEDILDQAIEQSNDDREVARILGGKRMREDLRRSLGMDSEILGVPVSYLLRLDPASYQQAAAAVGLVCRLRAAYWSEQAEADKAFLERLEPVTDGHPEMTAGEALRLIEERTEETIRGLEPGGEQSL